MRNKTLWIGIGVVITALLGGIYYWQTRPRPEPPLPLATESIGLQNIPTQMTVSVASSTPAQSILTDLNDDGVAETVFQFGFEKGDCYALPASFWIESTRSTVRVPGIVIYPSEPSNNLYPVKSLIVYDPETQRLQRLRRVDNTWQREEIAVPRVSIVHQERATPAGRIERHVLTPHAEWFDRDGDGADDTVGVLPLEGEPFALTLTADGRWESLPRDRHPIPAVQRLPSGVVANALTPYNALRWIGDIDGDGRIDRYEVVRRRLLTSGGGEYSITDIPYHPAEQWLCANLDGKSPNELVYFCPTPLGALIRVYQLDLLLKRIAEYRLPEREVQVLVRDLDSDGRDELVVGASMPQGVIFELSILRLQGSSLLLQKVYSTWLPKHSVFAAAPYHTRRTAAFGLYLPSGIRAPRTVFLSLDKDTQRPRLAEVIGVPVWSGDYDSDGNEEYMLSTCHARYDKCSIVQFRDGVWRRAEISFPHVSMTALPVHLNGEPRVAVLYSNGTISAVRLKATE